MTSVSVCCALHRPTTCGALNLQLHTAQRWRSDRRCWTLSNEGTAGSSSTLPDTRVNRGGLAPANWPACPSIALFALRLCQFDPHACFGHTCLGFFDRGNLARRHAFGNSIGRVLPDRHWPEPRCAFLCRQSLEEAATTAARISTRRKFSSSTAIRVPLCRRDTGRACHPFRRAD